MSSRLATFGLALILGACGSDGNSADASLGDGPGSIDAAGPDADPSAPTCTITSPSDGTEAAFDTPFMFAATATDLEDGALTGSSVVWRSDLQVAPLGNGTMLTTMLPPGTNLITCTATDSDARTGSASLSVISRSPFAQINHPGDAETRPASMQIPFVGVGRDLEDGQLMGGALSWTSNLDGMIGTDETFNRQLTAGVHTVTLTVTDSDANTDTASIMLTITP